MDQENRIIAQTEDWELFLNHAKILLKNKQIYSVKTAIQRGYTTSDGSIRDCIRKTTIIDKNNRPVTAFVSRNVSYDSQKELREDLENTPDETIDALCQQVKGVKKRKEKYYFYL